MRNVLDYGVLVLRRRSSVVDRCFSVVGCVSPVAVLGVSVVRRWSLVGGCLSLVVGSSTLAIGCRGCRCFSWVVDRGMSFVSWRVLSVGPVQLVIYRW